MVFLQGSNIHTHTHIHTHIGSNLYAKSSVSLRTFTVNFSSVYKYAYELLIIKRLCGLMDTASN